MESDLGFLDNGFQDTDSDGIDDDAGIDYGDVVTQAGLSDADGDVPTGNFDFRETDSDSDGISDSLETAVDVDSDGEFDFRDTDSDSDGIADSLESTVDTDSDGMADFRDTDSDDDLIADSLETTNDNDSNGIFDFREAIDSDGDGIADIDDLDDDNDGISDIDEAATINLIPNSTPVQIAGSGNQNNTSVGDIFQYQNIGTVDGISYHLQVEHVAERGLGGDAASLTNTGGVGLSNFDAIPGNFVIYEYSLINASTGEVVESPEYSFTVGDIDGFRNNAGQSHAEIIGFERGFSDLDFNSNRLTFGNFLNGQAISTTDIALVRQSTANIGAIFDSGNDVSVVYERTRSFQVLYGVTSNSGVFSFANNINRNFFFENFSAVLFEDIDNDGITDNLDLDSDNDGISNLAESGLDVTQFDPDGNGVIDGAQFVDADSDGLADGVEAIHGQDNGTPPLALSLIHI